MLTKILVQANNVYYMMLWFKSMGCVLVRHIYFTKECIYIYYVPMCTSLYSSCIVIN